MRKLNSEYENAIDNVLIHLSEYLSPYFYELGMTPNIITTLSNIFAIITIILLLNNKYIFAGISLMISYYFDCMDGYFARKYNMTSVFGDLYDHISDICKTILILGTLYYIDSSKFVTVFIIFILVGSISLIHLGCQENYYEIYNISEENNTMHEPSEQVQMLNANVKHLHEPSHTLTMLKSLCKTPNNNEEEILNKINYTKYFGTGTTNLLLAILFSYYY